MVDTQRNFFEYIQSPMNIYLNLRKMYAKKLSFFLATEDLEEFTVDLTTDFFVEASIFELLIIITIYFT